MKARLIPPRLAASRLAGFRLTRSRLTRSPLPRLRGARGSDLHALVGAYVMDALPAAERSAFERHLLRCAQCRDDSSALREATARLATATALPPRPELREQTLRAAALIRQQPPALDEQPDRGRAARLTSRSAAVVHRRPWLAMASAAVVAVLAATSIALGLHLSSMQDRLSATQQRDTVIAAILTAHDATMLSAHVQTGGTATVVMSHHMHELVFTASGLTSPPPSKAYELWLIGPAGATPAGMLPQGHDGMSGPMVVRRLAPGDQLGLTMESAGGSPHPTSAPIVLVALD
jgi:anti-sigma-K factor RskA